LAERHGQAARGSTEWSDTTPFGRPSLVVCHKLLAATTSPRRQVVVLRRTKIPSARERGESLALGLKKPACGSTARNYRKAVAAGNKGGQRKVGRETDKHCAYQVAFCCFSVVPTGLSLFPCFQSFEGKGIKS